MNSLSFILLTCSMFAASSRTRWASPTWKMKGQKMKMLLQSLGQILTPHRPSGRSICLWSSPLLRKSLWFPVAATKERDCLGLDCLRPLFWKLWAISLHGIGQWNGSFFFCLPPLTLLIVMPLKIKNNEKSDRKSKSACSKVGAEKFHWVSSATASG